MCVREHPSHILSHQTKLIGWASCSRLLIAWPIAFRLCLSSRAAWGKDLLEITVDLRPRRIRLRIQLLDAGVVVSGTRRSAALGQDALQFPLGDPGEFGRAP